MTITYTDTATGVVTTGSASIVLTVNTPPDVAISAPTCPLALAAGTPQTFAGVAADAEDGPLIGAWVDYLTGDTAAGNSWAFQSTVLGKHTLVFSATDSLGATASDGCTVTVFPAGATADALFPSTSAFDAALTNTTIELVAGDGAGNLLVGTQGELASFDATPALIGDWNTAGLGLAGGGVGTAIVRGVGVSGGKMLVGTSVGLAACTYGAGTVSACTNAEPGIRGFAGIAIAGDLAGTALVAAASSSGLYLASYAGGTPTSHFYARDVLTTRDRLNDVRLNGDTLYVATDSGLCVIGAPAAAVTTVATTLCDTMVDVGGAATSLAQSGGTLWIGTDSGLVGYDVATRVVTTDGLPGGRVNDVAIEASGVVWLGTDNGAVRFDPGTGWTTTLRPPDWSGSSTVNSVFIGADGSKWLGTNQGLVHYVGA